MLAISMALQLGKSAIQNRKANKLADTKRPTMGVPSAVNDIVNQYLMLSSKGTFPGQEIAEEKLGASTADSISAATKYTGDPMKAAAIAASAYGNEMKGKNQLAGMALEYKDRNISKLNDARKMLADFTVTAFNVDQMQPYYDRMKAASALRGAASQGFNNAVSTAASYFVPTSFIPKQGGTQGPQPTPSFDVGDFDFSAPDSSTAPDFSIDMLDPRYGQNPQEAVIQ